jgi:hypothetical protein
VTARAASAIATGGGHDRHPAGDRDRYEAAATIATRLVATIATGRLPTMQDIDRPANIQVLTPPAWRRGMRVHVQPV